MSTLYTVPLRTDLPWYYFKITLSGVIYTLRFRYNTRSQRWIMDLADSQDNDIVCSIPILIGVNLLENFASFTGIPNGLFFVLDQTGKNTQPTRLSFGTTHTLYYLDETA